MPGHDASIDDMYEAEAAKIQGAGGQVHRVVLDFECKKTIYGQLNKQGGYGNLSYARRQEDWAKLHELPIDLELATEKLSASPHAPEVARGIQDLRRQLDIPWPPRRVGGARADRGGAGLMSGPRMTPDERIANVQRLGYAPADAEFLSLVAQHGGYFVRRQFDAWIGVERGKRSEDFLAKLLDRGHCRRQVFAHKRQVFHVRFRPLYRAVGDENSRNRREHQPQAVKARLMTLDFVLAHPENLYFAIEREKVAHLCDERGIDPEALPAKVFRARDRASSTRRCFLDRFPLFARPGVEEPAFCYVDSGFETSGPLATHLRRCLPLFAELPSFELVYVATAPTRLGQVQTVFQRVLSRGRKWLAKVTDPDRLLAHFRDRQLFEKRETSDFDRLRLDALRDDMCCFPGRRFAQMFARWERFGDEAIRAEIAAGKVPNGRFSSCILPHVYDLFERIEEAS